MPAELGRATCKVIEELAAMSDKAGRSMNYGSTEAKRRAGVVEKW